MYYNPQEKGAQWWYKVLHIGCCLIEPMQITRILIPNVSVNKKFA